MKRSKRAILLAVLAASAVAPAQWHYYAGTGHYYQAVLADPGGINWEDARNAAIGMGGYLATIGSADENDFIFSLIDSPPYYWGPDAFNNLEGPWLGGRRMTDDSGSPDYNTWVWDNGDAWGYTNWSGGEPNNSGGTENRLIYFGPGNVRNKVWNDVGKTFMANAYVVESLVPEPSSAAVLILGALGVLARRRRQ